MKKLGVARELWQPAGETTQAIPAGAIYGGNRLKDGECSCLVESNSAQFFYMKIVWCFQREFFVSFLKIESDGSIQGGLEETWRKPFEDPLLSDFLLARFQ